MIKLESSIRLVKCRTSNMARMAYIACFALFQIFQSVCTYMYLLLFSFSISLSFWTKTYISHYLLSPPSSITMGSAPNIRWWMTSNHPTYVPPLTPVPKMNTVIPPLLRSVSLPISPLHIVCSLPHFTWFVTRCHPPKCILTAAPRTPAKGVFQVSTRTHGVFSYPIKVRPIKD